MRKNLYILFFVISLTALIGCGAYSFTGGNTGDAKTIQIDFFPNQAPTVVPEVSKRFTPELQDLFLKQTNLTPVKNNGDLHLEGEITEFRISPTSATSKGTAAQNRLTITVNVRYTNKLVEKDNFEKPFFFHADFKANQILTGEVLDNALKTIFDRITQDIFSASVAKW